MAAFPEAVLLAAWEAALGFAGVRRALALAVAGGAEPASVADLALGRRDEFLLALRERCFGTTYPCLVTCPACGEDLELELTGDDLRASGGTATTAGYEVRPVTSRDLLEVRTRRELLARCVVSAPSPEGEVPAVALSTCDPQADVRIDLDCASCGHRWTSPFDIARYLWTELETHARRLLYDVHALATAYGWAEADVLAVSPARRRYYLELAGKTA
ncbi:phage baseplate protein [Amycolatopsis jejuensis]|uniref:phage baseplate protein n=1 Tax=Amycolatopsis jejuensis TaxID=330084 RepID=UPI0012E0480D|nr:phage baseplate protein [Amycolatopsis jejuensis]